MLARGRGVVVTIGEKRAEGAASRVRDIGRRAQRAHVHPLCMQCTCNTVVHTQGVRGV